MTISNITSLLVPNKTVETEFPGMPGFKIKLCFLSRETLINIRKKSTKTVFKNRQTTEEFDEDVFLQLYVQNTIKGWEGLTLKYLSQLLPINYSEETTDELVEYSQENALALMKNSANFDSFITEQVTDLGNF